MSWYNDSKKFIGLKPKLLVETTKNQTNVRSNEEYSRSKKKKKMVKTQRRHKKKGSKNSIYKLYRYN